MSQAPLDLTRSARELFGRAGLTTVIYGATHPPMTIIDHSIH